MIRAEALVQHHLGLLQLQLHMSACMLNLSLKNEERASGLTVISIVIPHIHCGVLVL